MPAAARRPGSRATPPASHHPDLEHALGLAYRYLGRRERSVAELRAHLESRQVAVEEADQVIVILIDQGYLDDRRFAQLFVQDKRELEQWGDERIRRGLSGRGIDLDLIERALSEPGGEGAQVGRALALLRRRMPDPEAGRRSRERALGLLLRRGYEYEIADEAVRAHLSQLAPGGRITG